MVEATLRGFLQGGLDKPVNIYCQHNPLYGTSGICSPTSPACHSLCQHSKTSFIFELSAVSLQCQARSFMQVLELEHEVDQKSEGNTHTVLGSL